MLCTRSKVLLQTSIEYLAILRARMLLEDIARYLVIPHQQCVTKSNRSVFALTRNREVFMPVNMRSSRRVAVIAVLLLVILTLIMAMQPSVTKAAVAATTSNAYNAAPYVMPLANTPPNLPSVMSASG